MATKLDKKLAYVWYPQATGFVRNTLGAHRCDLILGFPQGDELVQSTNPYYRTAYALVIKPGTGLDDLDRLADPRLKDKRIGIVAGDAAGDLSRRQRPDAQAKPYPLVVDTRVDSPAQAMMRDLARGEIDVAILWGPMAGTIAQGESAAAVVPLVQRERSGRSSPSASPWACAPTDQTGSGSSTRLIAEQPGRHQQGADRLRRAAARREGPAHHRRTASRDERACGVALAAGLVARCARRRAQDPAEPPDYRLENYRAPTPPTLAGATVLSTADADRLWPRKPPSSST